MLKFNLTHPENGRTIKLTVYTTEHYNAALFLETWHLPINWLLTSDRPDAMERILEFYPYYTDDCLYLNGTVTPDGDYQSEYKSDPTLNALARIETDTNEILFCYHYDIISVMPRDEPENARIARIG